MNAFVAWLAQYFLAPLIVEVIKQFVELRAKNPAFAAASDAWLAQLIQAKTPEDYQHASENLQNLIRTSSIL